MNTASLELCKELYKLSRWTSPELHGHYKTTESASVLRLPTEEICPAYDLGYLLRKLGNLHVELKRPYINSEPINLWSCTAMYDDGEELPAYLIESASTPEDAACMVAIELFRQGVLRRE